MAEYKSCQANQRTIIGAIAIAEAADVSTASATAGQLTDEGSGWYDLMIPRWIQSTPVCPADRTAYYLSVDGDVLGDNGATQNFKDDHQLP